MIVAVLTGRRYDDPCGIARALDVIGDRWALLVVRELIFGPKRFVQLRGGLHGVSPNVLSQRLRDLQEAGIVRRDVLDPPASVAIYELTGRGRALEGETRGAAQFARGHGWDAAARCRRRR